MHPDLATYLERHTEATLLRFATAGSVDDGKSTMIGRLLVECQSVYEDQLAQVEGASKSYNRGKVDLAMLLDGLKAEREQGITIDVAYRYFHTARRRFIIADTPGHELYTRNTVTGLTNVQALVLLVDAERGLTTQTKRHAFIASLLGLKHLVVAINKMDLVDFSEARYRELTDEFGAFAEKLEIPDIHFLPMVATEGLNIVNGARAEMPWYEGPPLLRWLEEVYVQADRNLIDFRFAVQLVNRPRHDFRGYCGTIASGGCKVGDEVTVLPSLQRSRIEALHGLDGPIERAKADDPVTIELADDLACSRGDLLVHLRNQPRQVHRLEAMLIWLHPEPLDASLTYRLRHLQTYARADLAELHYRMDPNTLHRESAETLELNQIGRVDLDLRQPLWVDPFRDNPRTGAFILVHPMHHGTMAAGLVIEREPQGPGAPPAVEITRQAPVSRNITRHHGRVTTADRAQLLGQRPATIWLTGLSGSGKSTIGFALEERLHDAGRACFVLDGDNVRHGLNKDLGFSAADRSENIRRIAEVASILNDAGLIVITCFISPTIAIREMAREIIGPDRFLEVFVDTPLDVCEERDPKGLYQRARAGEIANFTGISAPFEPPPSPALRLPAGELDVAACATQVEACLRARNRC